MLCFLSCKSDYRQKYEINNLYQDWVAIYEVNTDWEDGKIIKCDTSKYCWLFHGCSFLRMFKDSTYVVYDTVVRKGTNFLEPKDNGSFQIKGDTIKFGETNVLILNLTADNLTLQESTTVLGRIRNTITTYISTHNECIVDSFSFPLNKVDTITTITERSIKGLDGMPFKYTRYDRSYFYHQDTILHLIKDIPINSDMDKDSIIRLYDDSFITYNLGEYGDQSAVSGVDYSMINCVFDKYITYYNEEHCYDIIYYGACHGDYSHKYETYSVDGNKILFDDIFKSGSKIDVNILIAEAIISHKKSSGWLDDEYTEENYYLGKLGFYTRLDYKDRVAIGKDGIIISLNYYDEDIDICFAENYITVIIPYSEIRSYLKYPFNRLAK